MGFEIIRDKKIIETRYLNEHVAEVLYEDGTMETTSDVAEAYAEAMRNCPDYYETHKFDEDMYGDEDIFWDIEDVFDYFIDLEEADKHQEARDPKPGDIVVVHSFYSPQSHSFVNNRNHYVIIFKESDKKFYGYALSSNDKKANKYNPDKPVYYDSIFIKDTATILYKGHVSSKPAIINVGDYVSFTLDDLEDRWYKGKVSYEFLNFIRDAARNAGTGKNKNVFWEK